MSRFGSRTALTTAVLVSSSATICLALSSGQKLYVNGQVASKDVIVKGGVAYVPIKDVAAALHMTAAKRSDGYAIAAAGGANQVAGMTGKVGDELFNGKYRFKVVRVVRGPRYTKQFTGDSAVVDAGPGSQIVAVVCRLKNGLKQTKLIAVLGGSKTALADTMGHSYGPDSGVMNDFASRGVNLLPGAAVDFALVFKVAADADPKDLVYEVADFPASPPFRVSLK
jgi:hypothetical protein